MYIQAIGTRHVNSTYSKRITSHIPTSLLVGSLPLAHNAEHFTSKPLCCSQRSQGYLVPCCLNVYGGRVKVVRYIAHWNIIHHLLLLMAVKYSESG